MKDHPILFCGLLVRAILSGKKTQTRRPIRFPKDFDVDRFGPNGDVEWIAGEVWRTLGSPAAPNIRCPYGQPGDRLWVRETWAAKGNDDGEPVNASGDIVPWGPGVACVYAADPDSLRPYCGRAGWRPSIHMPRWASRIDLEVVEVRVQRLQDITDEDADAEGTTPLCRCNEGCDICARSPVDYFRDIWDLLAPVGHGWAYNPWVWAVSFRRATPSPTTTP